VLMAAPREFSAPSEVDKGTATGNAQQVPQ
jgi:hypothetical protein